MSKLDRRQTRIVNSKVQKRVILSLSVLPAVGLSLMVMLVTVFCNQLYRQSLVAQAELDALIPLLLSVSGLSFVTIVFIAWSAFRLSHRIAGPMYRICTSLERIAEGDVSFRIKLRKGDHLMDIEAGLNDVLDRLNETPPAGFVTRESAESIEDVVSVDEQPSLVKESGELGSLERVRTPDLNTCAIPLTESQ